MRLPVIATALVMTALPAFATVTKTWVSSTGSDTGSCQLVAPCKTLQFAYSQTSPGGEIDVKDTGSYGALAITQAVSVVSGDGALAAIGAASGGVGVTVNAGPNDVVVLEGLFIDGHGVGQDGIDYNSGKSLTIQNCHIRNLVSTGIAITSNTAMLTFAIVNTEVAGAAAAAITTQGSAASAGTIATAFLHNNNTGIYAGNTNISISNSIVANNATGLDAHSAAQVFIDANNFSDNTSAAVTLATQANVKSYGTNSFDNNHTDVSGGSLTAKSAQ